jgi:hypothetical protein
MMNSLTIAGEEAPRSHACKSKAIAGAALAGVLVITSIVVVAVLGNKPSLAPGLGPGPSLVPVLPIHERLNALYSGDTGLIVSAMHRVFSKESLQPGVPVWACPPNMTDCTWHADNGIARKYASSSWISYNLYGELGVELYGCNPRECKNRNLLMVYNPSTTVAGAIFLADANTNEDKEGGGGQEGSSKSWIPPTCSQVYQVCATLYQVGTDSFGSCLKQAAGDIGDQYRDSFSSAFGGVSEGILPPLDLLGAIGRRNWNWNSNFVRTQKLGLEKFPSFEAFSNSTCGTDSFGYNEVAIRTANPKTVCNVDDELCQDRYRTWYCANQVPIALAYVEGSNHEPWGSKNKPMYLEHYQEQFEAICGKTVPMVRLDYSSTGKTPFGAFGSGEGYASLDQTSKLPLVLV